VEFGTRLVLALAVKGNDPYTGPHGDQAAISVQPSELINYPFFFARNGGTFSVALWLTACKCKDSQNDYLISCSDLALCPAGNHDHRPHEIERCVKATARIKPPSGEL
jgi:hypothetical protein